MRLSPLSQQQSEGDKDRERERERETAGERQRRSDSEVAGGLELLLNGELEGEGVGERAARE